MKDESEGGREPGGMADKTLHGKVKGYSGAPASVLGRSYPSHKNAQGQEVFGVSRSGGAKFNYSSHLNAYGKVILGPARSPGAKFNYKTQQIMAGTTSIGVGKSKGGVGVKRPMGGLV
jgi:hypothetical protein